ncbi:MAG: putative transrane protein, partial [Burkholderia sp.]|nr:putative transrane protein [Burkholderia sp.]
MHIVAIAWMYVVVMMSITEHSFIAGLMTFLLYGVLPVTVILYLMGTPLRKRKRAAAEKLARE